jgi:membrane protein involved in colicin uptake
MAKMKIKPLRTMFLDKRRVEQGKVEEVSEAEGKLAIRHGWAVAVDDKKEAAAQKVKAEAEAKAKAEAEAKAKAEAEAKAKAEGNK